ncbi:secretin and TonB N-terminal domain-containing protein [Polaromonas sp. YR568]|uniref:secretin and TonB N-terminal domain-containing protein n=1 Tax=Polaromonas sp. YR568 TaxID=1855301 RepID=UPI00398BC4DC
MRAVARDVSRAAVCACVLWMAAESVPAWAAGDPSAEAASVHGDSFDFDLPAQPLSSALERYAVITDRTVLFSDTLVAGRMSSPVKGRHAPEAALAALLAGTGLAAENPGGRLQNSFVLKQASAAVAAQADGAGLERSYDGLVQMRVWEALCADRRTAPGNYRASLRLNVDPTGRLAAPALIGSTGDAGRDQAVLTALDHLQMDHAPPAGLRQPLVLVILPRGRIAGQACRTGSAS